MLALIPGKTLVLGNSTHPRAFLAVVRSLGRLGLDVSVLVNEGDHGSGLSSRYVRNVYRLNSSKLGRADWVTNLLGIVANERFEAVIPTNDAVVIPLQEHRNLLKGLEDRFYLVNDKAYRVAHNKQQSRRLAERLRIPVAEGNLCSSADEVRALADRYGYPLILKPLHSFTIDNITSRQMVRVLRSAREIERAFEGISPPAVVEQFFCGHGCGVEFLAAGGRMLYSFQHERVHEPLQGGGSSYRKSVELHPDLLQAAKSIVEALEYTGVGMVEFKLDRETGRYIFIEINARFWGSLPLAVAAGADFPAMLYRMLWRGETGFSRVYRRNLYCRNETRDAVWFVQNLRADKSDPTLMTRPILSVLAESWNVVMGRERWDMLDLRDPRPALSELTQLAGLAWQKLLGSNQPG